MSITHIENIEGKNVTPPVNTEPLLITCHYSITLLIH